MSTGADTYAVAPDVVVAGAGPVGLFAALRLAQAGIHVAVFEREPALGTASKASTFHPSTLELLDTVGVTDDFIPLGERIDALEWRDLDGTLLAQIPFSLLRDVTRYDFRLHAEQTLLTPLLAQALNAVQPGALRFNAQVEAVAESHDGVRVSVRTPDGTEAVPARYVLAADGAGSVLRKLAGVDFPGDAYDARALRVITDDDLRDYIPGLSGMTYVRDDRGSCSLLLMRDHWRFIFRIRGDQSEAELLAPEHVRALVDRVAPGASIVNAHLYSNRHHVASRFRAGRVLLAGDAAHITTTAGGMNMNCGLQDAFVLSGALIEHLRDGMPETVLTDAAAARRIAVADVIIPRTEQRAAGADGRRAQLRDFVTTIRTIAADTQAARRYLYEASMFDTCSAFRTHGLEARL